MVLKWLLLLFIVSFVDAGSPFYRAKVSSNACDLPRIDHGRVRVRQRSNFVKFMCLARYTLIGNKYATCRDGNWDVPIPVCIKSGCEPLPEVKNSLNISSYHDSWIVFFCMPGYKLINSPVVYCDGKKWNATAPTCVDTSTKPETSCDFEDPYICGWKQDEEHDFDWRRLNRKTPSSFLSTGPSYDHTYGKLGSGYYMYIESTGRTVNDSARLVSPVYEAELARNGCFIFYYHMFGRELGGLRVYQKPDTLRMDVMLALNETEKDKYILFEEWGNHGNEWFNSATVLTDFEENFQIVIEGIRGQSFTSDIAIDDVSLLQGEQCVKYLQNVSNPPSLAEESCQNRCDYYGENPSHGCGCSLICLVSQDCCPDFLEYCLPDSTTQSDGVPQTEKLVATSTPFSPSTLISRSTSTTPTYTTPRSYRSSSSSSTTLSTITTTSSTTTKPTTKVIITTPPPIEPTTARTTTKTPRTTTASTTKVVTTTVAAPTTKVTIRTSSPTTKVVKPTRPTTPKVTKLNPTTIRTTTKVVNLNKTTTVSIDVPKITSSFSFVRTTNRDERQREKMNSEDEIKKNKKMYVLEEEKIKEERSKGSSGTKITIILVVLVLVCGMLWAGFTFRGARGTAALARLRGRVSSDSEVRFLKSDDNDE